MWLLLAEAADRVAAVARLEDESVGYRLGRSIARMEAAMSTPDMFGRVAIAQTMRDVSPDLMDTSARRRACPRNDQPNTSSGWRGRRASTAAP